MFRELFQKYRELVAQERQYRDNKHIIDSFDDNYPTWDNRFKISELKDNRYGLTHQIAIHVHHSLFEVDSFRVAEEAEKEAEVLVLEGYEKYKDYFIGGYVMNGTEVVLVVQSRHQSMITLAKLLFA